MVYVDENLCTGCGTCVDGCNRGALSVQNCTAVIDEALCTSCGRCVDLCLTGAIITLEVSSEQPTGVALIQRPGVQPAWAATPAFALSTPKVPVTAPGPAVSQPTTAASRVDVVGKVLSGLSSVITFILDRRQSHSTGSAIRGACSGERHIRAGGGSPRDGRGLGGGQGRGGRCSSVGRHSQGNRHGADRQNRTT
jgi:NAD-dependent dihydropyrimidine dehydrogenase PreA subunit